MFSRRDIACLAWSGRPCRSPRPRWAKRRVSAVLGIHRALCTLFAEECDRIQWMIHSHDALAFGGRPPMSFVTSGTLDDLITLRRFLDAARGGIYMAPNAADVGFEPYKDDEIVIN